MKNLKATLGAAAVTLVIGAAAMSFTMNDSKVNANDDHKKVLNTYYPVRTGPSTFSWQQINLNDYECVAGAAGCAGFNADTPPAPNTIPAGYTQTNMVLQPK
ncbi:hypothetical protein [Chryseobacterium populi]|uniref:Uncharacterized protein n=1 Tax=Chryseobacterium populi TaxID=1144316 RepID=J2K2J5_9FLAO|nr:hypothetical protein [Chryseobacterium populi]EJL74380.1 hypothetical protein PMI13_01119 [Chryseobacterium populi]